MRSCYSLLIIEIYITERPAYSLMDKASTKAGAGTRPCPCHSDTKRRILRFHSVLQWAAGELPMPGLGVSPDILPLHSLREYRGYSLPEVWVPHISPFSKLGKGMQSAPCQGGAVPDILPLHSIGSTGAPMPEVGCSQGPLFRHKGVQGRSPAGAGGVPQNSPIL